MEEKFKINDSEKHQNLYKRNLFKTTKMKLYHKQN